MDAPLQRLPPEIIKRADSLRGEMPRKTFLTILLKDGLDRVERDGGLTVQAAPAAVRAA